jgi:ParB-like chromosome segregation protein Spo0J
MIEGTSRMTTIPISRPAKGLTLGFDQIEIPATARPYNATALLDLSRSIAAIGLQSAPTVVKRDGHFVLVAGPHRIEALKLLGIESVLVRVVDFDDVEARMWTISENLHRAELTGLLRSEHVAEYARLAEQKREEPLQSGQVAQIESKREDGRGHRHEGGDSLAARDLGISRDEVRRAKTIAALPEETKRAGRDARTRRQPIGAPEGREGADVRGPDRGRSRHQGTGPRRRRPHAATRAG